MSRRAATQRGDEGAAVVDFVMISVLLVFLFIRKVIVHSEAIRAQLPGYLRSRAHVLPHVNYQLWARAKQVGTFASRSNRSARKRG